MIFEGEYLNGELRSGKGKECNFRGITAFEGEYINGEKNGIIYENNIKINYLQFSKINLY